MKTKANIFWCTGMSGAGKSTLAEHAKYELEMREFSTLILDGDVVREENEVKLGFGPKDVENNNLHVASLCEQERYNYNVIIVPIISPINVVRSSIRKLLSPGYYLIYIKADIESLRKRDPKGLYQKADNGEITDLIGYSYCNPYEQPEQYDLIINTSNEAEILESKNIFTKFIIKRIF